MPNNHGGKRDGAGRKPSRYQTKHIKIAADLPELDFILSNIKSTRQRALILINWIMDKRAESQQEQPHD